MRVCIVCVCHNTHKEFEEYYFSIRHADKGCKVDVVLLDNSTKDPDGQMLRYKRLQESDERFFYKRVKNLGYLGTVQQFLKTTPYDFYALDYLCISNVDLKLEHNFFVKLENALTQKLENVGMIAPNIITADNINKNPKIITRPTRRNLQIRKLFFSSLLMHLLLEIVHSWRKRLSRCINSKEKFDKFGSIYAAHGSFFIFTKPSFEFLANETYPVFLFGEEIFLAELMRKKQLSTYYVQDLIVNDSEHASTGKMKSSLYRKYNRDALDYIMRNYF